MKDDRDIVERILQGDTQAFNFIINNYKGRVFSLLRKMLGNSPDIEDIAQEVFIKAYNHLRDYKPENSFSAWIYRIAANHCLDELRKRKRIPDKIELEMEVAYTTTPESSYLDKERQIALNELIMELDPEQREIFLLRHKQYMSYKEIGEHLSIPISTVQMRLYRARLKLQKFIKASRKGGESLYELYES